MQNKEITSYQKMYVDINKKFAEVILKSLEKTNGERHAAVSHFGEDYAKWMDLIGKHNESLIYSEALNEYNTMLLFLCMGLYKNAYMALRGYFELTLFGVLISTNDLEFRKWRANERDIHWAEIKGENGVFGADFVKMYNADLLENRAQFQKDAEDVYRKSSEYIHSGFDTCSEKLEVDFDQTVFDEFYKDIKQMNRIITYAFCVRYGDVAKDRSKNQYIEESILDQINDIANVQKWFI